MSMPNMIFKFDLISQPWRSNYLSNSSLRLILWEFHWHDMIQLTWLFQRWSGWLVKNMV